MSASLVGSEMCIRDRPGGPPRSCCPQRECECQAEEGPEPAAGARPQRDPVSYTHLTLPTICSV
eukprot:4311408-Alexandrium_andersonii.AAC.1